MTDPIAPPAAPLHYLPASLFGAVIGLCGLSLAWQAAARQYAWPALVGDAIGWLAIGVFVALALAYGVKCALAWPAIRAEFAHPIAGNLFGTGIVSLLLLPLLLRPYSPGLAAATWWLGATLMLLFSWHIVGRWMNHRQLPEHATPAWLIPIVGLLDLPIAGVPLGLPGAHELALLALAVGLFFTVPLFALVFSRLLFEAPLPDALRPSLLILMAPFAVGFSAYTAATGRVDLFAGSLFYIALFLFCVLLPKLLSLGRCCPFKVAWWAVGFPLAATTIAALKYAAVAQTPLHDVIAQGLLLLTSAILLGLLWRTAHGIVRGELRHLT